jgi:hypothetical protein
MSQGSQIQPDDLTAPASVTISRAEKAKILLLDVCTRWSSTHIMLGMSVEIIFETYTLTIHPPERALLYRDAVERYAQGRKMPVPDENDWKAIETVCSWLKIFRDATTQMSSRDKTTISSVFGVFLGLQNHIRQLLRQSASSMPDDLRDGLLDAHEKLAEYFKKSDASPYYMWAACKSCSSTNMRLPSLTFH